MPAEHLREYGDYIGRMYGTELNCSHGGKGLGPLRELGHFYEMLLGCGRYAETLDAAST